MRANRFAQVLTLIVGLSFLLAAVALLAAPQWFFENIGHHPPFNRHYMGDAASFLLPLGIGLMLAARDPARHRLIIGLAIVGGLVHTFNHGYDAWVEQATATDWLLDIGPVALQAVLLIIAYYNLGQRKQSSWITGTSGLDKGF